jgi:hypothetical protein
MAATSMRQIGIDRVLTGTIASYIIGWTATAIFVSRVFGVLAAVKLSVILALPLAVALRLRFRRSGVRRTELALLLILAFVTFGIITGVVLNWYDYHMDLFHNQDVEYAKVARAFDRDPSFLDVELYVSPKHTYWMSGSVPGPARINA